VKDVSQNGKDTGQGRLLKREDVDIRMLTTTEATRRLWVTSSTISAWCRRGESKPGKRTGGGASRRRS